MSLTYGELFAGYGGLGMGVQSVLGGEMAWCAEFDAAPSKILAHHWPDVPNYGDVTKIDWHTVPKVDVITGGSPCQDLSHAGKRAGMKAGTRSGLWASMCDAIDIIRPRLVVWENVRGALSAEADSALEQCAGCVGDGSDGVALRALGRVLGDLADLGYDCWWYGLRASDVGAPHGRFRVFVFATPADAEPFGWGQGPHHGAGSATTARAGQAGDARGHRVLRTATDAAHAERGEAEPNLLGPTSGGAAELGECGGEIAWGKYAPSIARWAAALGRPAPAPSKLGRGGKPNLSAEFVEWMMGLPEGHVTAVEISDEDMLKALGNGVVPQQAAAATRSFLSDVAKSAAA